MQKYYIGLASTFHDSAIAILDTEGKVLFAEATERRLQYKRALNCPPDNFDIGQILKKYCDADADFVVATSWSEEYLKFLNRLERMNFFSEASLLIAFCIGSKKKGTDMEARTNSAGLACFSSSSDQYRLAIVGSSTFILALISVVTTMYSDFSR